MSKATISPEPGTGGSDVLGIIGANVRVVEVLLFTFFEMPFASTISRQN